MRMVQILAILVAFSLCSASFADQIVLTNGDRLTGTITKSDDKTLVIKTEFAGDVTVQWPAVQEIHSMQALHLVTRGEKTLVGTVTTSDGNLVVGTATSGTVNVPKADVTRSATKRSRRLMRNRYIQHCCMAGLEGRMWALR